MKVKRRKVKRYRKFTGEDNGNGNGNGGSNYASMPASQYIMGLIGVGVLFFVVGYGWEKGKTTA
jgi:hypothetical protein